MPFFATTAKSAERKVKNIIYMIKENFYLSFYTARLCLTHPYSSVFYSLLVALSSWTAFGISSFQRSCLRLRRMPCIRVLLLHLSLAVLRASHICCWNSDRIGLWKYRLPYIARSPRACLELNSDPCDLRSVRIGIYAFRELCSPQMKSDPYHVRSARKGLHAFWEFSVLLLWELSWDFNSRSVWETEFQLMRLYFLWMTEWHETAKGWLKQRC